MTLQHSVHLEYTSTALLGKNAAPIVEKAQAACRRHGFTFGVQAHNVTPREQVEQLVALGIPLTVHAPILSDHLINLAAEDSQAAFKSIETTIGWMRTLKARLAVIHGFIMTDTPIPAFNTTRPFDECFRKVWRKELCIGDSTLCDDFTETDEFAVRYQRVKMRLREIRENYPEFVFAIENDFPCYGSGLMRAEHAAAVENPLCLDTGHLWAASHLFGRSFHEQAEIMVRSGNVRLVHFHASPFNDSTPRLEWRDGHLPLSTPNTMDLPRLVACCKRGGVRHFTFEIGAVSEADIDIFAEMWNSA